MNFAFKNLQMNQRLTFLSCFAIAATVAVIDHVVRASTAGWSNHFFFQSLVSLSPIAYTAPVLVAIVHWRSLGERVSAPITKGLAVALCALALSTMAQALLRREVVGSAVYSPVWPLFGSGIPLAVLTLAVYFRRHRALAPSAVMALVALLWALCPLAMDAMYKVQRGYRGAMPLQQIAVIGSTHDFLVHLIAYTLLASALVIPALLVACTWAVARSKERLLSFSVALSLLAFELQVLNWGIFIFD